MLHNLFAVLCLNACTLESAVQTCSFDLQCGKCTLHIEGVPGTLLAIVLRCPIHQGPSSIRQSQCVVVRSVEQHGPSSLLRSLGVPFPATQLCFLSDVPEDRNTYIPLACTNRHLQPTPPCFLVIGPWIFHQIKILLHTGVAAVIR